MNEPIIRPSCKAKFGINPNSCSSTAFFASRGAREKQAAVINPFVRENSNMLIVSNQSLRRKVLQLTLRAMQMNDAKNKNLNIVIINTTFFLTNTLMPAPNFPIRSPTLNRLSMRSEPQLVCKVPGVLNLCIKTLTPGNREKS